MPRTVSATWMRGGTSKCWVFDRAELEIPGATIDEVLLRLFGSPDPRQLDGIGGATSTTSKAVILSRSDSDDADVEYTFAQVGIDEAKVDWGSNCGNCSSVVAPYALEQGWVRAVDGETMVRVRNTNTDQVIWQRVATPGGVWDPRLDTRIPGVVFPGTEVGLGFVNPAGRTTGRLLPTGAARDAVEIDGEPVPVTLVDAGAPLVIIPADAAGLADEPHAHWSAAAAEQLPRFDAIRRAGAVRMGMVAHPDDAERAIPKLAIVGPAREATADLEVLMMSMGKPHPAVPVTGSVGLTVAAGLDGSVVADAVAKPPGDDLRLRTPAGVVSTWRRTIGEDDVVGTIRTARTIARSTLLLPIHATV